MSVSPDESERSTGLVGCVGDMHTPSEFSVNGYPQIFSGFNTEVIPHGWYIFLV